MRAECGFVPYPDSGAYGHWTCQLPRRHRGRHRFINYTVPRVPRVWRGARPLAYWVRRRWKDYWLFRGIDNPKTFPFRSARSWMRQAMYDARYEPVDR